MASLLTNVSAQTALQTLKNINKDMSTTQNRIATGLKVGEAADNAAYWSIATSMRSHNMTLSAVQDSIGLGQGVVDLAYTGLNEAIELTKQIQQKYVALAQHEEDSAEATALNAEITQLKTQVGKIAEQAEFQGRNLLTGVAAADPADPATAPTMDVVTGYLASKEVDDGSGGTTTEGGVQTLTVSGFALDSALEDVDSAEAAEAVLKTMTAAAGELGAYKVRLDSQARFTTALTDSIDRAVGILVDADMNEESARLSALQVQQQLGIQALSMANQNAQNILALFR